MVSAFAAVAWRLRASASFAKPSMPSSGLPDAFRNTSCSAPSLVSTATRSGTLRPASAGADVSGVIEDLDLLLKDFLEKIENARMAYLDAGEGSADEKLERVVGWLFDPDARKAFYEAYKDIEALGEILSPSPELRDHIESYKNLALRQFSGRGLTLEAGLAHELGSLLSAALRSAPPKADTIRTGWPLLHRRHRPQMPHSRPLR
jgi:hypothetical protein